MPVARPGTSTGARRVDVMGSYYTDAHDAHPKRPGSGTTTRNGVTLTRPIPLWLLRIAWVALPLTAGPAASAALRDWSDAPRVVAEILLWLAWATRVTRDHRTATDRAHRIANDRACLLRARGRRRVQWRTVDGRNGGGVGHDDRSPPCSLRGTTSRSPRRTRPRTATSCACRCACRRRCSSLRSRWRVHSSSSAWRRDRCCSPTTASCSASSRSSWASPLPSCWHGALHRLSLRWAVLVPAGFVVVDPMTLADPVLFPREGIAGMQAADATPCPARRPRPAARRHDGLGAVELRPGRRAVPGRSRSAPDRDGEDLAPADRGRPPRRDVAPRQGAATPRGVALTRRYRHRSTRRRRTARPPDREQHAAAVARSRPRSRRGTRRPVHRAHAPARATCGRRARRRRR